MSSKVITSGLFIFRKDKKFLVCHPTNHKENFFSIPKGKVEEDEIFLECAIRETYEETNLDLKSCLDFDIYYLGTKDYKNKKKRLYPFLLLEKDDSQFDWNSIELKCNSMVVKQKIIFPEMDGYKWITIKEAKNILHETQVSCLIEINEIINN
jgi:8-oxo-dGTP pyrophosphatase MutT (NUDIX family)